MEETTAHPHLRTPDHGSQESNPKSDALWLTLDSMA